MRKLIMTSLATLALGLMSGAALAHDLWITVDNPQAGQPAHIVVGYGHAFPADEGADKDKLAPAYLIGPAGRVEAQPGAKLDFVTKTPLAEGSYVAVSGRAAQWYTKSPEGYQDKPKNQVPGAVTCIRSAKYAKAILNVGKAAGDVSQPVGQTLEITPLANPAGIKAGGGLPVQVLFEGKPLAGCQVFATFAGFSDQANTFAFAAKTDKEGKAVVKVWHPGLWLVLAKHEAPFADPAECDKFSHSAALTFNLK
ncbi:MAG: DUF4198 domain-containing protein [Thermodesulfobacteriota bacterium]